MNPSPNQGAAANHRPARQSDDSGNLSMCQRLLQPLGAFPAAVAELGSLGFGGSLKAEPVEITLA